MQFDLQPLRQPCACGRQHNIFVQDIRIEPGALNRLPEYLKKYACSRPAVLCDENTFRAAGQKAARLLGCGTVRLNPENLHANEAAVAAAEQGIRPDADILIAAGSGTVHDITRFIANRRKISFVSVPTAASVDGFVSTVAAMTWGGFKITFPAVSPVCVLADTDIFSRAPYRLTASGISDLLGKYTAVADWRIAHLVTGEYLCERVCSMELDALKTVRENIGNIRSGDAAAYEQLMYALLLSGLAMQMVGNSRPASGAEHHISHLLEMGVLSAPPDAYHGEKVGVGLLLTADIYHRAAERLRRGRFRLKPYRGLETDLLREAFRPEGRFSGILKENSPDPLSAVSDEMLEKGIPDIIGVLDGIPSVRKLSDRIASAGGVRTLPEIGLPNEWADRILRLAPYVRNRLTFLRLLKRFDTDPPLFRA